MSEPRPELLARLRDVDEALARREPAPAAIERVRRTLEARAIQRPLRERLRWWPALAFAGGAALMGVLLVERPARESTEEGVVAGIDPAAALDPVAVRAVDGGPVEEPQAEARATALQTAEIAPEGPQEGCLARVGERMTLAAGACLEHDGVHLSAIATSSIRWQDDEVAVIRGELLFDVDPRPERPLRVRAGASAIEVVGTRFVVHHQGRSGWISMLEGHVRVRVGRGSLRDLRRGARMEWPGPDAAREAGASATTTATATVDEAGGGDEGLRELLAEVRELRRRGAYRAAVERLREGERSGWSARGQELVSYEIGALLERQLGDTAAACAHWQAHRRRFPGGRYDGILERTTARLGCVDMQ